MKKKSTARKFNRAEEKIHDLYKLEAVDMKKNVSYTNILNLENVSHTHFFHTIDVAGNEQNACVPIGGHFHIMEVVTPATETDPPVYRCSTPMKWVRKRDRFTGKWVKVAVPANDYDDHIHPVQYKDSHKFMAQPLNPAAEMFVAAQPLMSPPPALEGVISDG